jgi:hypothetical protein
MEQRIYSLQNASALKCDTCRPLLEKVRLLENNLKKIAATRRKQFQDLFKLK